MSRWWRDPFGRHIGSDGDAGRRGPSTPAVTSIRSSTTTSRTTSSFSGARSDLFRVLAEGDVRYVGDPIAMVVAENRYQAEDAVDAVGCRDRHRGPLVDNERALDPDAPLVHPGTGFEPQARDPAASPTPDLDAVWRRRRTCSPRRSASTVTRRCRWRRGEWSPAGNPSASSSPCGSRPRARTASASRLRASLGSRRDPGAGDHARRRRRVRPQDDPLRGGGRVVLAASPRAAR